MKRQSQITQFIPLDKLVRSPRNVRKVPHSREYVESLADNIHALGRVQTGRGRKLFGVNVRSLRLAKGLSQESLADACDLHRTYIGSIERGERNISIDSMERIANALGVEVPDLLRVAG